MDENNVIYCSSDMPAIEDKLGTGEQQRGLVEFMRHCSTPMTIAVQGDWGTGKTSMMQLLKNQLHDINGSTLWFPTWQFAVLGEQDRLLMDLLMLLCCKLKEKCSEMDEKDEVLFHKLFRFIKRVGRAAAIGSIYLATETGKTLTGIDSTKVVDEAKGVLEKLDKEKTNNNVDETNITYESFVMQVSELHKDLTLLIDAYLGENKTKRLYIFIDDLDRLEPVRAVELLEGIKNFLDIPRCVFMLAIDTKVVMEGLKAKYGENMDKDKQVHFFDKIIQIPYKLPVHNYDLNEFMKDVLKGYDEENLSKYLEFLTDTDIHNPRTIKRCVNFCLLHKYIDSREKGLSSDKDFCLHLFAVKMLELEHEDIYSKLLTGARTYGENYADLKAWLLVEEKLKFDLFEKVLKCFEIHENADDTKIGLFAEYIILSAPAKLIEKEQNVKDIRGNDLRGAYLSEANLFGADLRGANLSHAYLSYADLGHADLIKANLSHVNLSGADLSHAYLIGANLSHANLIGADLSHANLREANLIGADLREANLIGADLREAKFCRDSQCETIFPAGFNPEEYDMIEVDIDGKPIKQTMTDEQSEIQPITP